MNIAIVIDLVVGTPIAALAIGAVSALFRHHKQFSHPSDSRQRGERIALQLLLAQTLVPPLQFIADLNVNVTQRPGHLITFSLLSLAFAAVALFLSAELLLLRNTRGAGRIVLPLLSLLAFLFSTVLVLTLGATA
jgi:hypothetical protein